MTKKSNKPTKATKMPDKGNAKKALPVKAWEKLKGHGPFPSVAVEAYVGKNTKEK